MEYKFKPSDFVKLEILTESEWRTIRCQYYQVDRHLFRIYREARVKGSRLSLDK